MLWLYCLILQIELDLGFSEKYMNIYEKENETNETDIRRNEYTKKSLTFKLPLQSTDLLFESSLCCPLSL